MFLGGFLLMPYALLALLRERLEALAPVLAEALPVFAPRLEFLEKFNPAAQAPFMATVLTGCLMLLVLTIYLLRNYKVLTSLPRPKAPNPDPHPPLPVALGCALFFAGFWLHFIYVPEMSPGGLTKFAKGLIGMEFPFLGVLNLMLVEGALLAAVVALGRRLRLARGARGG